MKSKSQMRAKSNLVEYKTLLQNMQSVYFFCRLELLHLSVKCAVAVHTKDHTVLVRVLCRTDSPPTSPAG